MSAALAPPFRKSSRRAAVCRRATAAGIVLLFAAMGAGVAADGLRDPAAAPSHAIAMHGAPALAPGFAAFR